MICSLRPVLDHRELGSQTIVNFDLLNFSSSTNNMYQQMILQSLYRFLNDISASMPTRKTSTTATIIDHFITNIFNKHYKLSLMETNLSDPNMAIINIDTITTLNPQQTVTSKFINFEQVNIQLEQQTQINNDTYDEWINNITTIINTNTSTTTRIQHKVKYRKPYINKKIVLLMNCRESMYIYCIFCTSYIHPVN